MHCTKINNSQLFLEFKEMPPELFRRIKWNKEPCTLQRVRNLFQKQLLHRREHVLDKCLLYMAAGHKRAGYTPHMQNYAQAQR